MAKAVHEVSLAPCGDDSFSFSGLERHRVGEGSGPFELYEDHPAVLDEDAVGCAPASGVLELADEPTVVFGPLDNRQLNAGLDHYLPAKTCQTNVPSITVARWSASSGRGAAWPVPAM